MRILIENHLLNPFAKFRFDFVIDFQHAGIDDPHVETSLAGVIKKTCMHGFPDKVVAAEGKGNVTDSAASTRVRATILDFADRIDEVDSIGVVFGHARGEGKYVWVENYVLGGESDFRNEDFVRSFTNPNLVGKGGRLALFVKGHDDHGSSVSHGQPGVLLEYFSTLLQAD